MRLTEGLYSELIDTNVRVTVVFPGGVATNISVNSGVTTPEQAAAAAGTSTIPLMQPGDVARIMIDAMERNACRVMIGSQAKLKDRLSRLAPLRVAKLIYKEMRAIMPSHVSRRLPGRPARSISTCASRT